MEELNKELKIEKNRIILKKELRTKEFSNLNLSEKIEKIYSFLKDAGIPTKIIIALKEYLQGNFITVDFVSQEKKNLGLDCFWDSVNDIWRFVEMYSTDNELELHNHIFDIVENIEYDIGLKSHGTWDETQRDSEELLEEYNLESDYSVGSLHMLA